MKQHSINIKTLFFPFSLLSLSFLILTIIFKCKFLFAQQLPKLLWLKPKTQNPLKTSRGKLKTRMASLLLSCPSSMLGSSWKIAVLCLTILFSMSQQFMSSWTLEGAESPPLIASCVFAAAKIYTPSSNSY